MLSHQRYPPPLSLVALAIAFPRERSVLMKIPRCETEWGKRSDRNFSDFGKNNGRDAGNHPFEARGRVSTRRAKLDEAWRGASAPMGSEPGEARAGSGASMMRQ